jgi:hypothetical protein
VLASGTSALSAHLDLERASLGGAVKFQPLVSELAPVFVGGCMAAQAAWGLSPPRGRTGRTPTGGTGGGRRRSAVRRGHPPEPAEAVGSIRDLKKWRGNASVLGLTDMCAGVRAAA